MEPASPDSGDENLSLVRVRTAVGVPPVDMVLKDRPVRRNPGDSRAMKGRIGVGGGLLAACFSAASCSLLSISSLMRWRVRNADLAVT